MISIYQDQVAIIKYLPVLKLVKRLSIIKLMILKMVRVFCYSSVTGVPGKYGFIIFSSMLCISICAFVLSGQGLNENISQRPGGITLGTYDRPFIATIIPVGRSCN